MINVDRIVPVTATDLITLYGFILKMVDIDVTALDAVSPAEFVQDTTGETVLAAEPVKSFDFGADVEAATVYFVAAYDYVGFTKDGEAIEAEGEVEADGRTLYTATLESGAVTIERLGF